MATIVETKDLDLSKYSEDQILWLYNGLDCLITNELFYVLHPVLEEDTTKVIYNFEKAMQGPALTMMRRGFRIDHTARLELIAEITPKITSLGGMKQNSKGRWEIVDRNAPLQRLAVAMWDKPINYNSRPQLLTFLYGSMRIPKHYHSEKGKRKVSTRREQLERIIDGFPRARPFLKLLLRVRDLEKKLSVLTCEFEPDGRLKCSFKIGGTETGRWSSSKNCYWRGTNLQNVTKDLRKMFVADPGYKIFYADLKTAESKAVGYLSGDEAYIEACDAGDPHTVVAAMVFRIPALREEADKLYYRHFSFRDMAKRGGHGTNYVGTPRTMAHHLRTEEKIMHRFQVLYYGGALTEAQLDRWGFEDMKAEADRHVGSVYLFKGAFPKIKAWHENTKQELQKNEFLCTPLGRKRKFWGRIWTDETLREGVAFVPQSLVADILNLGLLKVWKELEGPELQLLANGHDAIVGQVREDCIEKYRKLIPEVATIDIPVGDRTMTITYDIKFADNWKEAS